MAGTRKGSAKEKERKKERKKEINWKLIFRPLQVLQLRVS
jgi:hypothetical protein